MQMLFNIVLLAAFEAGFCQEVAVFCIDLVSCADGSSLLAAENDLGSTTQRARPNLLS